MAGLTLAQAQAKLDTWMKADDAVAAGQAHTIGNRAYTAADAGVIRQNVDWWDKKCRELAAVEEAGFSGPTIQNGIP